jgi:tetratricopeptide (TPR) repeat protein
VDAKPDASFRKGDPLSSADVHMLMHDAAVGWDKKARTANVDEALSEDPTEPEAIVIRTRSDESSPLETLKKSVAAHPADWRAWFALGEALPNEAAQEKEAAFRKAVALNPESARAQNSLAVHLLARGRAKEALPIANRALDLAPWDPDVLDTLAGVAAALQKCREALTLERRAAALASQDRDAAKKFRNRTAEYESSCGRPIPTAATPVPGR